MTERLLVALLCVGLSGCFATAEHNVKRAQAKNDLGQAYIAKQQWRPALRELLDAKRLDPTDPAVRYHLALTYFYGFERATEAEQEARAAIRLRKNTYSEAHNLLGLVLNRLGRSKEAIKQFQRALENLLYATPYFAEQNLAQTLILIGQKADGIRRLEALLKTRPYLCGGLHTLIAEGLKDPKSGLIEEHDPAFMKHCVRLKNVQKRIPKPDLRRAYRRAVRRALAATNRKLALELAKECRGRIARAADEPRPSCPKVPRTKR
jgi:tetratricopeptide (TPR) repeat protein